MLLTITTTHTPAKQMLARQLTDYRRMSPPVAIIAATLLACFGVRLAQAHPYASGVTGTTGSFCS